MLEKKSRRRKKTKKAKKQADDEEEEPKEKEKKKRQTVDDEDGEEESIAKEDKPKSKTAKKQVTFNEDEDIERAEDIFDDSPPEEPSEEEDQASTDFMGTKKKKKKETTTAESWTNSDRDYHYQELLARIYYILNENNPELIKSKNKYVIKPPEVLREGTKKTVWANFQEICNMMNRQSDHVLAYAKAELGTSASIDGNQRLVIKGRFQPKQIERVVRHYVAEYVSCRTCKSANTILKKENRIYFIQCKSCGSTRSVAPIKQGFVAQIGKRKKTT